MSIRRTLGVAVVAFSLPIIGSANGGTGLRRASAAVADCASPAGLTVTGTAQDGPLNLVNRDLGVSLKVGSSVVYAFGDHNPSGRSNSAGWGDATYTDRTLIEVHGGGADPIQWIPLDATDLAYNANPPDGSSHVALWPTALVKKSGTNTGAVVFYDHLHVNPLSPGGGIGVASFQPGSLMAAQRKTNTNLTPYFLFREGVDKQFQTGAVADVAGQWLYLFFPVKQQGEYWYTLHVARAAIANDAFMNRSSWRFWTGATWSTNIAASYLPTASRLKTPSGGDVATGNALSIAYNSYLGCYVMLYWTALGWPGSAEMRLASDLKGPWSEPINVFDGPPVDSNNGGFGNRQAFQNPALSPNNGSTIVFTYYAQNDDEVRVVRAFVSA